MANVMKTNRNDSEFEIINFRKIEEKWQKRWEKEKIFEVKEDVKKKKFTIVEMYPYPSGSGLHIGHAFNYTIGDILARYKLMKGFNVLHPMGYDSFGLPAENAAIKNNSHPRKYTEEAITNFIKQQKSMGFSYDWSRKLQSHDPEYYKWNQYFFLQFFEKGLVYRKKAPVNWCLKCNSVLANEQIHNGKCWVHKDNDVEIKHLEQWFLKITDYAEELLNYVDELDWPERIKAMQRNWIGKSEGVEIIFKIGEENWSIFTTRPDTLFGVTFMVISAQHPILMSIVTEKQRREVENFLGKIKTTKQKDIEQLEKEGVFTGSYAIHPLSHEKIPIYVGNFVIAEYGSGMVMAVPAHDQRDFEFAVKYNLPIRRVIRKEGQIIDTELMKEAYAGEGILVSSNKFDGMSSEEAREKIVIYLEKNNLGKKSIQYKLRDWLISRQRYWGTPIPMIYCDNCGIVPVLENDLPVLLPEKVKFGEGNPLATNERFVFTKCSRCEGKARRETDTMDTFFDSSWYYLRYCDAQNKREPFDKSKVEYWMPVDFYTGGAEHACMHLIYARFFSKVLRDSGFLKMNEPFLKLFNQGMIHGEDGFVMSKSRGNVVDPLDIIKKYGADVLRIFLVSMTSPDKDFAWNSAGIEGSARFVLKIINYFKKVEIGKSSRRLEHKMNLAIREVTREIENLRYNFAVIGMRGLIESLEEEISKKDLESIVKLISPFCPHIAEELWEKIGRKGFVSLADWPEVDESKINDKLEESEKAVEKSVGDILNIIRIIQEKQGKSAKKVYLYVLPNELEGYDEQILSKRVEKEVRVFAVNAKEKYDPQGKAGKAKPGKPGIYVE